MMLLGSLHMVRYLFHSILGRYVDYEQCRHVVFLLT
jgi:hypothetical protein